MVRIPPRTVILSERARGWRASRKPALSEVEGDPYSRDIARVGVLRLVRAKTGPHSLSMTNKMDGYIHHEIALRSV